MSKETDLLRRAAEWAFKLADDLSLDGKDEMYKTGRAQIREDAIALLALADERERAEPVAWLESPHGAIKANPVYRMSAPQSLAWRIPLYTHPAPEVQRDAERYRWLRADHSYSSVYKGEPFIGQQLIGNTGRMVGEHADRAVDKAMAAMQEPKP